MIVLAYALLFAAALLVPAAVIAPRIARRLYNPPAPPRLQLVATRDAATLSERERALLWKHRRRDYVGGLEGVKADYIAGAITADEMEEWIEVLLLREELGAGAESPFGHVPEDSEAVDHTYRRSPVGPGGDDWPDGYLVNQWETAGQRARRASGYPGRRGSSDGQHRGST